MGFIRGGFFVANYSGTGRPPFFRKFLCVTPPYGHAINTYVSYLGTPRIEHKEFGLNSEHRQEANAGRFRARATLIRPRDNIRKLEGQHILKPPVCSEPTKVFKRIAL